MIVNTMHAPAEMVTALEMLTERVEQLERAVAKLQRHEPSIIQGLTECAATIGHWKPQIEALVTQAKRAGWIDTTEHE